MAVLPRSIQFGNVGTILSLCNPPTFLSQHLRALRGLPRDLQHPLDNWAQFKALSPPSTNPFLTQEDHTLLFSPKTEAASEGVAGLGAGRPRFWGLRFLRLLWEIKVSRLRNISFSFPPANEIITAFCILGNYFLIMGAASAIYIISLKQKR